MADVRVPKHRANRAVAALLEATGHASTLLPSLGKGVASPPRPITRFRQFSELEQSRRAQCPLQADRKALADMQETPAPRDELAAVPDAVLTGVMEHLGGLSSDGVTMAAVNDRLQQLSLTQGSHGTVVTLVPTMLSTTAALAQPGVLRALTTFFGTDKRGHAVESLSLVESSFAATTPPATSEPLVLPSLHLPQALRLVAQLTYLRNLDLRGVSWYDKQSSPVAEFFLSDLHLVAPRLEALKIGTELCRYWPAGWWQRHHDLSLLVIGSRREEAACSSLVSGGAGATPPLSLDADFFTMLSTEQRPWRVKLWCRLTRDSMLRLLGIPSTSSPPAAGAAVSGQTAAAGTPATPSLAAPCVYQSLTELSVNLQGNTEVCGWVSEGDGALAAAVGHGSVGADTGAAGGESPRPQQTPQRAKGKRGAASEAVGDAALFPLLTTLTIANVEERVMSAAEVLGRFYVLAPALANFNVCNTVRLPAPEKIKGSRQTKPAAPAK